MHYFYILHSASLDKHYIGETSDLPNRLDLHRSKHYKNGFTKAAKDWEVLYSKHCKTKQEAVFIEKFVKRMKSRAFIRKVIDTPSLLDDIWNMR